MSRKSDPFTVARQMMDMQKAQLDLAETMLKSAQEAAAWQKRALSATQDMAKAQRQWLALWGIK
jgi:hypothetical protein